MISHSFSVELATKVGIEKAILLQHFYFWHQRNEANDKNFHDGHYWTYNTAKAFNEIFPYISEKRIYNLLKSLEADGFILTGNYNKIKFDRTKWYALSEKSISIFQNGEMEFPKKENPIQDTGNPIAEKGEPIPDINSYVNTNVNTNVNTDTPENKFSVKKSDLKKEGSTGKKRGLHENKQMYNDYKDIFMVAYKEHTGTEYYFGAKDAGKIYPLIRKIRFAYESKGIIPNEDQMKHGVEHFIDLALKDKWIRQNLSLSILDSKFNEIKANRNGKSNDQELDRITENILQDIANGDF